MFLTMCGEEFSAQKLLLDHFPAEEFTICWFQKKSRVVRPWIAYRLALCLYFTATFIYVVIPFGKGIREEDMGKFFIFLTNWTYTLQTILFSCALYITVKRYKDERGVADVFPIQTVPKSYKVYWALYNIVLSSAVVVSVIFWVAVFDPVLFPANGINVILHAMNSIVMVLDFILISHPIRIVHLYLPSLYGIFYALFNVIYFFCGGTGVKGLVPIYKVLDWREPGKAIGFCFACLFFVIFVHVMFSLLSHWKRWMKKKHGSN